MTIYLERSQDLSIYHWLKNQFTDAPFITIVDSFPETELVIPTISIDWDYLTGEQFELGNRKYLQTRQWYFDIFAKNKSQRDDIAYRIFNEVDDGIPVYDYNEGYPEQGATPSRLGSLNPKEKAIRIILIDPALVDELYYRAVVDLTTVYDQM